MKTFFQDLGQGQRMKDLTADIDRPVTQPAAGLLIRQQIFRQQSMQVEEGERIETHLVRLFYEHFDGCLVIKDHLGFQDIFPFRRLTELDQILRVKTVIRISFQPGRSPRKIDQQPVQNFPGIRAGRTFNRRRAANFM